MRDSVTARSMTVDEYFRLDESSDLRHEYVAGEVYALSGATARHGGIAGNVFARLFAAARGTTCRVFMNGMRLQVADDVYYYPDVTVTCRPVADADVVLRDPCLVVEVTSPSTARVDRREKLDAYRRLPSLRAYLVIDHRRRRVERHGRGADDEWLHETFVGEGSVVVPCLDVTLTLDEIYDRVDLPAVGEPQPAYEL